MTPQVAASRAALALWCALTLSLLAWIFAGYSWVLCAFAVLPLLAPLKGLVQKNRYTYAWASLFAVPYCLFAITELLVNPKARLIGALTVTLVLAWFLSLVAFLRISRRSTTVTH
jgi:uncharacterized membrane protein